MTGLNPFAGVPEIKVSLQVQPEFGSGAECFCEAQGHFGADAHVAVYQLRDGFAGNAEVGGERGYRDPEGIEIHFF